MVERIPYALKLRHLPVVLSTDEVARFLAGVPNLKHRMALTTAYAPGLRVSEVVRLKIAPFIFRPLLPVADLPFVPATSSSERTRPRSTERRLAWPTPITALARDVFGGPALGSLGEFVNAVGHGFELGGDVLGRVFAVFLDERLVSGGQFVDLGLLLVAERLPSGRPG